MYGIFFSSYVEARGIAVLPLSQRCHAARTVAVAARKRLRLFDRPEADRALLILFVLLARVSVMIVVAVVAFASSFAPFRLLRLHLILYSSRCRYLRIVAIITMTMTMRVLLRSVVPPTPSGPP